MKLDRLLVFLMMMLVLAGCGGGGSGAPASTATKTLVSLNVTPDSQGIALGTTEQFKAIGTYSDSTTADVTDSVTWSSSSTAVAAVSNSAGSIGKATAVAVGSTTITASSGPISDSTTLTVTAATLTGLTVTPAAPTLAMGLSHQFIATGTFSDNSTQDLTGRVLWTSSASSVATMSNQSGSQGVATAVAPGATTITASSGGITGSTTLTVVSATLVSIAVAPATPTVALGSSQQFTATGTYSDHTTQDLTASVTWSSSLPSVALIGNATGSAGKATSLTTGSTTITATMATTQPIPGTISGSTTLTVSQATVVSLAVSPSAPTVTAGNTEQFTATATYSDDSTQDVTSLVTWSSSSTSVATITNASGSAGTATTLTAGVTTITATLAVTQPVAGSLSSSASLTVAGQPASTGSGSNVMTVTVNGSLCSSGSYPNKPCVSVTICTPGTSNCQTVSDLLLDTGSYGLRIFKQALNVTLPQLPAGSGTLTECVQYGDGSSHWGPVASADLVLGGEPAVTVPIQVIDSTFGTRPRACSNADTSPSAGGFNGILGVGLFAQDCGAACAASAGNGNYYSCSGSTCSGTTVSLARQVQNPVSLLPVDNNGVLLQLPGVSLSGASYVNGSLILGIGTRSNNTPSGVTGYPADGYGEFTTTFNGTVLSSSFLDSGSNGLFFPDSGIPLDSGGWFAPSQTMALSATNSGAYGSPSGQVSFQLANSTALFNSYNNVFNDLGANMAGAFDWGLPFFLGRSIYVGIEGTDSSLGTGPYWGY
ncbi:hypothetical protein GMSM_27250 [Geomonas sp. Red276]